MKGYGGKKLPLRLLAWVLTLCMGCSLLPVSALAGGEGQMIRIAEFDPLDTRAQNRLVPAGTAWDALALPETLAASGYPAGGEPVAEPLTVAGVTWEIDPENPANDGNSEYHPELGSYCLTPVLPQGYELAPGAELPEIYVRIDGQASNAVLENSAEDSNGDGYHDGDVAVINAIIRNNGLKATLDAPASWSFATWNSESPKRIMSLNIDSQNPKLTGTLDVSGLTGLTDLYCGSNSLNTLKGLDTLQNLKQLQCQSNQLASLEGLGSLSQLGMLYCQENQLTSLEGLGSLSQLWFLNCKQNQLTSLDVSGLMSLRDLECLSNKLTSLEGLGNLRDLEVLNCQKNQLTTLEGLGSLSKLNALYCQENQLTSLDVSNLTNLTMFSCNKNPIASLKVSDSLALTVPAVEGGTVMLTAYTHSKKSVTLTATADTGNAFKNWEADGTTLTDETANPVTFTLAGEVTLTPVYKNESDNINGYSKTDVDAINAIIETNGLSATPDDPENWTFATWNSESPQRITNLLINNRNPKLTGTLNVSGLTSLTKLYCANNQLTGLEGLENLTNLTVLFCDNNQLTGLEGLENLTRLTVFSCGGNRLTGLDGLSSLTSLTFLDCQSNQLMTLDGLSSLTSLTDLWCGGNKLTSLEGLGSLSQLEYLDCQSNQLTSLEGLGSLSKLNELYCQENQLTSLDVSNLSRLTSLSCLKNPIASLKLSENLTLTVQAAEGGTVMLTDYSHSSKSVTLKATADTGNAFKKWEADGTTLTSETANPWKFTLVGTVTITPVFSNPNAEAVAAAKTAIEGGTYTVTQANAGTQEALKTALAQQINNLPGMSGTGVTVTAANITVGSFTAATAGDADAPNGTDGSFSFTVALSKGTASDTTSSMNGTITATAYEGQTNAEAVAAAKTAIEGGTYTVTQANAGTQDALETALAQQINNLPGMSGTGVTVTAANITVGSFTAATAGNADAPNGTDGSFSFTVALFKGTASGSTSSKTGTITATPAAPAANAATIHYETETVTFADTLEMNTTEGFDGTPIVSGGSITSHIPAAGNGALYLRVRETGTASASPATAIAIPARPAAPGVTIDYAKETLATTAAMQYAEGQDGSGWTACAANMGAAGFGWNGTEAVSVRFRTAATNSSFAGAEQTLAIPARPTTSGAITAGKTARSITVTAVSGNEYRIGAGDWISPASGAQSVTFSDLAADTEYTVEARQAATQSAFSGTVLSLKVQTKAVGAVTVPTPLAISYGAPLGSAALPEHWAWSTPAAIPTVHHAADTYTAVYSPADSETVDYSGEQGYASTGGKVTVTRAVALTVTPKPLEASMISAIAAQPYTGSPCTPAPTVADGDLLQAGDYTVGWSDNIKAGEAAKVVITATDTGNYSGSAEKSFTITPHAYGDGVGFAIADIAAQTYTGEAHTPEPVVQYNGVTLVKDTDYTLAYADNTGAGEGKVKLTFMGNFSGTAEKTFAIDAATPTLTLPTGLKAAYTGEPVAVPEGKVTVAGVENETPGGAVSFAYQAFTAGGAPEDGFTAGTPTAIGDYWLRAEIAANGNYGAAASAAVPFTVTPCAVGTGVPTEITTASVRLHGSVAATKGVGGAFFRLWPVSAPARAETAEAEDVAAEFTAALTGLAADTEYAAQAAVIIGGQEYAGGVVRFRTPPEARPTGEIGVAVIGPDATPRRVAASIEAGNTVIASQMGEATKNNHFSAKFTALPDGYYNIVVRADDYAETRLVEVKNGEATKAQEFTIPAGSLASVVEIKTPDTPNVAVGGLQQIVTAPELDKQIEVKLAVEKKAEAAEDAAQTAIKAEAAGKTIGAFLDLSLFKTITENGVTAEPEDIGRGNSVVLEIAIPYDTAKSDLAVYRHHIDATEALEKLSERPASGFADGKFFVGNGYIFVYASGFSTYAIAYTERRGSSSGSSGTAYSITATAGEGGSISPSGRVSVARNAEKTFAIAAKDGYEIAEVLVDGKSVGAVARYTFEKVTAAHTIEARFREASGLPFDDVRRSDWFYDSVRYVYEHGLMNGTGARAFSPELSTDRGMIVTILWRMEGAPRGGADMTFRDVAAGSYCYEAVRWAAENGVVKGYDAERFGPEDTITREQLAAILYRYGGYKGYDVRAAGDLTRFADAPSDWAREAVAWAVGAEILSGQPGGLLDPLGSATRAEAATVLMRFAKLGEAAA